MANNNASLPELRDPRLRACVPRSGRVAEPNGIAVDALTVRFDSVTALEEVTASFPLRRLTAIVGPSGCGKTTLLKALSCELPAGSGTILIQEVPARLWPEKKRASCLLTSIAPQCVNCESWLSNDCALAGTRVADAAGFGEAFALLGIRHLIGRACSSLSPRDARRVRLASAIAPVLSREMAATATHLWLDDPLDGLDSLHAHRLMHWLADTAPERQTTVVTLMDYGCARSYAHHAILLSEGRVVAAGSPRVALAPAKLTAAFRDRY